MARWGAWNDCPRQAGRIQLEALMVIDAVIHFSPKLLSCQSSCGCSKPQDGWCVIQTVQAVHLVLHYGKNERVWITERGRCCAGFAPQRIPKALAYCFCEAGNPATLPAGKARPVDPWYLT